MARPPRPRNDRPFAVRDFPSYPPNTAAQRPSASSGFFYSPPHPNYPPTTAAQRPSASRGFFYSPPYPNYPPTTAAQRPSASRDFPPLCGNAHEGFDVASTHRRVHGTIPRDWLQFLLLEQADDGEAATPLPATDNDDSMTSSDDADVEDLVSARESDDVGGDDISNTYVDDLLFSSEIDEYLNSDGLPEEVVTRFMKKMSCEEVAAAGHGDTGICAVCQDDLCGEDRTDVGVLGCLHRFHADCIGKWLQMKNVCPLCKAVAHHFL